MTGHVSCIKLQPNSVNKKAFEKPQPVKIKQLLEQCIDSKSAKKESARKKIQPERLGVLSNIKKEKTIEDQNGTSYLRKNEHSTNHVQRRLNFNAISNETLKSDNLDKNELNAFIINQLKDVSLSKYAKKKSLLLPPNTIKDKYMLKTSDRKRISKISKVSNEMLNQVNNDCSARKNTRTMKVNSTLPLMFSKEYVNKSMSCTASHNNIKVFAKEDIIVPFCFSKPTFTNINHDQSLYSLHMITRPLSTFQHESSGSKSIENNNQLHIQDNSMCGKNMLNARNKRISSTQTKDAKNNMQSLRDNFEDIQVTVSRNDMNVEDGSSEIIYVNKDKIMRIEKDLKILVNKMESNVLQLKLISSCVRNLVLTNNKGNLTFNTDKGDASNSLENENNTVKETEISVTRVETHCKATQCPDQQQSLTGTLILTTNLRDSIISKNSQLDQENKNVNTNVTNSSDKSFLDLESQMNIEYTKSDHDYSRHKRTPTFIKGKQKRSMREYMALKSNMSFLSTPDGQRFKPRCCINNTPSSIMDITYISNKVLKDLHNLYCDSPQV